MGTFITEREAGAWKVSIRRTAPVQCHADPARTTAYACEMGLFAPTKQRRIKPAL